MQLYLDVRKIPLRSGKLSSEPQKTTSFGPGLWHTSPIALDPVLILSHLDSDN